MKAVVATLLAVNLLMLGGTLYNSAEVRRHVEKIEKDLTCEAGRRAESNQIAAGIIPAIDAHLSPLMAKPPEGDTHAEALFDRLLPFLKQYVERSKQPTEQSEEMQIETHTLQDARTLADRSRTDDAKQLAECLATIDQWIAIESDEQALQEFKRELLIEVRTKLADAIKKKHKQCLSADGGAKAAERFGEAAQLLALYPISDEPAVIDEAQRLSTTHAEVGVKLDVLRRQRYNLWALKLVSGHLKWLDDNRSSWSTKDNKKVVTKTAEAMGEIDPNLLEPVVAQLYAMALSKANTAINAEQQSDLAALLVDPEKSDRRNFGDF